MLAVGKTTLAPQFSSSQSCFSMKGGQGDSGGYWGEATEKGQGQGAESGVGIAHPVSKAESAFRREALGRPDSLNRL